MKKLAALFLLVCAVPAAAQTISYYNLGLLRQPSAAADRAYLGIYSATNIFDSTLTATNFATTVPKWVDVPMNYAFSAAGGTAPSLSSVGANVAIQLLAFDNNDQLFAQAQMPHSIAVTNAAFPAVFIEPHIHWSTDVVTNATHRFVRWSLEWQLANIATTFSLKGTNYVTNSVVATNYHHMSEFGHITNNSLGISAVFRCRLSRPNTTDDIDAGVNSHHVFLDGLDIHAPIGNLNALGSSTETAP